MPFVRRVGGLFASADAAAFGRVAARSVRRRVIFVFDLGRDLGRGSLAHLADDEVVGEAEAEQVVVEALCFLPRGGPPAQADALLDGALDEFLFGRLR